VENPTITFTVEWDETRDGVWSNSYTVRNETTATGTNFAAESVKFDDSPKTKWYSYEQVCAPKKEEPPVVYYEPLHPWEEGFRAPARVRPQRNVRDSRSAVWACRPRHGLSGR
jgi:hypothetical protein